MSDDDDVGIGELKRAINLLRADFREANTAMRAENAERFTAIDRRLAELVPRGEHDRTVQRLDQRADVNARDIGHLRTDQERDRTVARQGRQWAIGTAVAVGGLLVAYLTFAQGPEATTSSLSTLAVLVRAVSGG